MTSRLRSKPALFCRNASVPSTSLPPLMQHAAVEPLFARLDCGLVVPSAAERREYAAALVELAPSFADVATRIEEAAAKPVLRRSELAPLRRLAFEGLAVMRRIQNELDGRASAPAVLPPAEVESMIDINRVQLTRLESQLGWLESFSAALAELHPAVCELRRTGVCRSAPFRKVARRLMADARRVAHAVATLLEIAPLVPDYLARGDASGEAPLYATGFLTAALLALCIDATADASIRLEPLVVASLLQDAGLLVLLSAMQSTADGLAVENPAAFDKHAAVGAALAGGVRDYAADLPMLIAAHHERVDGTGPNRTEARRLSTSARVLASAVRFVELYQDAIAKLAHPRSGIDAIVPCRSAAERLHREAEQGELDLDLSECLLDALRIELQSAYGMETAGSLEEFLNPPLRPVRLRLDEPHGGSPAGPHFKLPVESPRHEEQTPIAPPHFLHTRRRSRSGLRRS